MNEESVDVNLNTEMLKNLTADSMKYWSQIPYGLNWLLRNDSVFVEYTQDGNIRERKRYGDVIWEDDFKFILSKDTLSILNYNNYKFLIIKLTEDSLIVKSVGDILYLSDTLSFIKSPDQQTELIIPPLLSW